MRNAIDWQYVRREIGEAARLAGYLVVVGLATVGFWTVLGWAGLGG